MTPPAMDAMTIPTIFETCRPRKDVLASGVVNLANNECRNPTGSFADTYQTCKAGKGLRNGR